MLRALLFLAFAAPAFAQSASVDLQDEPHYKLLLQNEFVKVWKLDVPGRDQTRSHRHRYDYLTVALRDADISHSIYAPQVSVGEAMVSRNIHQGEIWYMHGGYAHFVRNNAGLDPVQEIDIEILQIAYSGNPYKDVIDDYFDAQQVSTPVDPEATYKQESYFYSTFVTHDRLNAGDSTEDRGQSYDHLVIALTDLKLTEKIDGKSPAIFTMNKGEVKWMKGGFSHRLVNEKLQAQEWVTVEIRQ